MTELFDCAELWDQLPPEKQREIGAAAVLFVITGQGQASALAADDMRRSRFFDVAGGVAIDAMEAAGTIVTPTRAGIDLPDLRPFGIDQCKGCGCIEEVACKGGCSWAEKDLCSACVPVMAEAAHG